MVWGRLPPSVRVFSLPVMVVSESVLLTELITGYCPKVKPRGEGRDAVVAKVDSEPRVGEDEVREDRAVEVAATQRRCHRRH